MARYVFIDIPIDIPMIPSESVAAFFNVFCLCFVVTIEIVNDVVSNEMTFKFSSDAVTRECVYSDAFSAGDFVYGILPDGGNGKDDDFYIDSITVSSYVSTAFR